MKTIQKSLLATLFALLATTAGFATTYYYDNDSNTAGFGTAGGTWAAPTPGPTPGWTTDATGATIPGSVTTATTDALNFGNGATGLAAGTITVNTVSAGSLTFASGSGSISLSSGTITLGTATAAAVISQGCANAQTINSGLTLGNNVQTISLSGGDLALGGAITSGGTASAMTLGGTKSLTLNGSTTLGTASGNILVGTTASTDRSVLNIANNVNIFDLRVGGNATAGSCGAVYQTGGAVSLSDTSAGSGAASSDRIFSLGANASTGNAGYGYYNISGNSSVTLNARQFTIGARADSGALGVMDIAGGVVTATDKITLGRGNTLTTAAYGVLNVTGGSATFANVTATTLEMGYTAGGFGIVNVNGGNVTQGQGSSSAGGVDIGNQGQASTGMLNLKSGTLTVCRVFASSATPTALVNFNGGTLKATTVNFGGNFMPNSVNIDAVTVYGGGGTIDNNGTSITIGTPLIAPAAASSVGVTGVTGLSGGSGYIGAPIVQFTGGTALNGKVAAGYAVMSGGSISSTVITSPGDYSTAPTGVSFTGGGGTGASVTGVSTSANTSGGMTFKGSGVTTLSGVNTYSGGTTVTAGTLLVNNSVGSGAVSVSGSGSILGGSGTISGATIISNNAALRPRPNGGSATALTFGSNLALTNASAIFTLSSTAGGSNDKVLGVSQLTVDSTVTFSITNTSGLDQSSDYTLISSTSTNTGAGGTPTLVVNGVTSDQVTPGNYKLLVTASGVALHFIPTVLPTINSAIFSPNPQHHNGSSTLTVLVTPAPAQTISSISVGTDNIGGVGDSTSLTRTDGNGPGLQETWIGTFNVSSSKAPGSYSVGGTATQSDSFTASYSASLTVVSNITLLTSDASTTSSFIGSTNWSDGLVPGAGNAYFTSANTIRTTNATISGYAATFAGDSLSIDLGGRLLGKFGNNQNISALGTLTFSNLVLNGGYLDQAGGANGPGDSNYMAVAGAVTVNAFSGIGAAGAPGGWYETLEFLAPISGSGALQQGGTNNGLLWPGLATETGLVKLSAANPYSGTYTIPNTGSGFNPPGTINRMLQLNNLNALSNATLNLTIANLDNPVSFASGVNTGAFNVGALSGSTSEVLSDTDGGAVGLSVGGNNASNTYSGVLSGNGSLIKVGTNTLTLSGASTYTGNTTVNAGTLALTGAAPNTNSQSISIGSGATLDVFGLTGSFVLGASQVLSNSASGTGNLNCGAGGIDAGSATVSVSFVSGTPSLNVGGGTLNVSASTAVMVNNTGGTLMPGTYRIISQSGSGAVFGTAPTSVSVVNGPSAGPATLSIAGGELFLTVGGTSSIGYSAVGPFTYDGAAHGPVANYSGSGGLQSAAYVGLSVSYGPSAAAPTNAGTYSLTNTLVGDGNYFGATNSQTFVISPLAIGVTADAQTNVYGMADPALTYTFAPVLVNGDSFNGGLDRTAGETVGMYPINQGTLSLSANYTLNYTGANLAITPAALSITASNASKSFGQTVTFGGTEFNTSGLVAGDSVTGVALASAGATNTAVAGTYPIVPGAAVGVGLTNYNITYDNGTLTVTGSPDSSFSGIVANHNGSVTLTFSGSNGVTYRIQATSNLVNPLWTDVSTNLVGVSNTSTFTDTNIMGLVKFYRVICP